MANQWPTFVNTYNSLQQTFDLARLYFNDWDWDNLEPLLDKDVVLKRVSLPDPDDLVRKKTKVMKYLRAITDHPNFGPTTKNIDPNLGVVSGNANWVDDNNAGGELIRYFFLFGQDNAGDWKILFIWGSAAL
jgi:hypothetical protein